VQLLVSLVVVSSLLVAIEEGPIGSSARGGEIAALGALETFLFARSSTESPSALCATGSRLIVVL
jgi:hypothetical protein